MNPDSTEAIEASAARQASLKASVMTH